MRFHIIAALRMYSFARSLTRRWLPKAVRMQMSSITGRLLYRLLLNADQTIQVQGHGMFFSSDGRLPPVDMLTDTYEPTTTTLFKQLVRPGMTVVDIGAHIGYYTLLAARTVGENGRVLSFEADSSNYAVLVKNIELNSYSNVIAVNQAVSNYVGKGMLSRSSHNGVSYISYSDSIQTERAEVIVTTLDAYLTSIGDSVIDLVKIDVEGSEFHVIEGMTNLIQISPKLNLIIEFHPRTLHRAGIDSLDLLRYLESIGLKVHSIEDGNRPVSYTEPGLETFVSSAWNGVNLYCYK